MLGCGVSDSWIMKKVIKKVALGQKKITKMQKQCCQIPLISSKTATESLKSGTVFCFDLQSKVA